MVFIMPPRRQSTGAIAIDDFFSYDYACYENPIEEAAIPKGVRFDETVAIVDRGEITQEELNLMWYSNEDLEAIMTSNVTDLWSCTLSRGLEGYHLEACDIKNELQKRHIHSILALQAHHKEAGVIDQDGLKTHSLALSKEANKEARQRAERDAIDAFRSNRKSPYIKASTAKEYAKKTTRLRPLSRSKSSV